MKTNAIKRGDIVECGTGKQRRQYLVLTSEPYHERAGAFIGCPVRPDAEAGRLAVGLKASGKAAVAMPHLVTAQALSHREKVVGRATRKQLSEVLQRLLPLIGIDELAGLE